MTAERRVCGSCTACCKSLQVTELQKPAGTWCEHCAVGSGCKVYASRPAACVEFECQWLKGFGDESMRPDRLKVILDYVATDLPGGTTLQMWEVSEGALDKQPIRRLTTQLLRNGQWVSHLPLRGNRKLFVPLNAEVTPEIREACEAEGFTLLRLP